MTIEGYIKNLNQRYGLGNATEHTFRGDLQQLLEAILPGIAATNEPKRQSCGAPDYILTRNEIPVGFIEAKDIGDQDLEGKKKSGNKEQFDRYKASLSNLIFTDYLDFHLYQDGTFITKIAIAEIVDNQIKAIPQNFKDFTDLFRDFTDHKGQTIKSSKKLAEMMAGKARLLSNVIEKSLTSDETNHEDSTLKEQMIAFKDVLIHDITPRGFADVYAQTIAYGLFAARLHDPTLDTFSRQEAAELIPKSNPFLRTLFGYIAGPDIDDRIKWIVENLSEIFLACNVEDILKSYGKSTKMEDPIIHFYETFLAEYDPKLRKARGVWYTPAPVVNFIVRAVDDILKTEFNLPQGLADTSKTTFDQKAPKFDERSKSRSKIIGYETVKQETHRVQILDPATGTGTFLAEVIKHVNKKFKGQEGIWSSYVENHLLPRLNGFELLMASYAMAHLQLDLLLKQTGFKANKNQRTKIYLTNSLDEYHPDTDTFWASTLANEANEANRIKRDTPVMCIIGNPPYSGESANKGKWIMDLMQDYKKEPGGKEKLKEQNSKFINDDYVKFIRYSQHYIEKNGSGVLAFINPHGFLDNPTFRGMRWNLLKTYDKIYTIDLHGNSKKKEVCPDGSPDQNVFDIMQGVAITIFVKTGKKKTNQLGKVFNYDLFGKRNSKYEFLNENSLKSIPFIELPNKAPNYFMVQKDFEAEESYNKGFALNNIYLINSLGLLTKKDKFITSFDKQVLQNKLKDFMDSHFTDEDLSLKHNLKLKDNDKWNLNRARLNIQSNGVQTDKLIKQNYRCFDERWIYYDGDFVARLNTKVLDNVNKQSLAIISTRQLAGNNFYHLFISNNISDQCFISNKTKEGCQVFPLYLYSKTEDGIFKEKQRTPNLNQEIVNKIAEKLGLNFTNEKEQTIDTFAPIDILDYIYAVLHSPTYREKYKEFLKIDFPRVPYPKDQATFWKLVKLGLEIRQLHLLENPKVEEPITNYRGEGDNIITRKLTKTDLGYEPTTDTHGKVWINDTQYFDHVPLIAWDFYIGGYQPAQKWLKDRKGRVLGFEDIFHYGKIIVSLTDTYRIMQEIDTIKIE